MSMHFAAAVILAGLASIGPALAQSGWPMLAGAESYSIDVALEGDPESLVLCGVHGPALDEAFAGSLDNGGMLRASTASDLSVRLTATVASSGGRVCAVHLRYDVLHVGTHTLAYNARQTRAGIALVSASTMLLSRPSPELDALIGQQLRSLADGFVRKWRSDQEP